MSEFLFTLLFVLNTLKDRISPAYVVVCDGYINKLKIGWKIVVIDRQKMYKVIGITEDDLIYEEDPTREAIIMQVPHTDDDIRSLEIRGEASLYLVHPQFIDDVLQDYREIGEIVNADFAFWVGYIRPETNRYSGLFAQAMEVMKHD